jgi:DNA (cytosine-5)-methyltransferase 1
MAGNSGTRNAAENGGTAENSGTTTTFFDLFAGVGGFRLGLERAGWKCVGWCEIDRFCQRVYRHRFPDAGWFWPDATTLDPSQMPDFDFLVGGVPCQSWSVAGKRRGFEDSRGTLWFDAFRILEVKRPRGFIFENVKGLVCRPFRDREFRRILEILRGLGYLVFWRVLNSKNYGVPQNRERVFIVGFRHDGLAPADFPWPEPRPLTVRLADVLEREVPEKYYLSERTLECLRRHLERHRARGNGFGARVLDLGGEASSLVVGGQGRERNLVTNTLLGRYGKDGSDNLLAVGSLYENNADAGRVYSAEGVACTLKGEGGGLGAKTGLYVVLEDFFPDRVRAYGGVAPTLRGGRHGLKVAGEPVVVADRTRRYAGLGRGLESPKVVTNSLTGVEKDNLVVEPASVRFRIRRLTPRECERLQGFPDDWTRWGVDERGRVVEISDTQRYKMMGNAVTVPVVEALGRAINAYVRVLGWA